MSEPEIKESHEIELLKPDLKSVLWQHLNRLNYIGTVAGDSKAFVNAVESLVAFLRCWKSSRDVFVGQTKEIDSKYTDKLKNARGKEFLEIQSQAADEKRNACMDFIGKHLGGETGKTEY